MILKAQKNRETIYFFLEGGGREQGQHTTKTIQYNSLVFGRQKNISLDMTPLAVWRPFFSSTSKTNAIYQCLKYRYCFFLSILIYRTILRRF
jgi:hypothetical protein